MGKKTRQSQCKLILEYLQTHEGITDNDARDLFHCNRLSGRIYDLRNKGYAITTDWRYGKNVYGNPIKYGFYYLEEDNA